VSAVLAKADARGGRAGEDTTIASPGGDAVASASATGLGHVESWASATGGASTGGVRGGEAGDGGSGYARASADGASGFARAEAAAGAGLGARVRAQSLARVGSRRDTEAVATHGQALASGPSDPELDGFAFLTGVPLAEDAESALRSNAAAAVRFEEAPGSRWIALGSWMAGGGEESAEARSLETEFEITLGDDVDRRDVLVLAALEISAAGDAFEGLTFGLEQDGVALGESVYLGSIDAVIAYFANTVIEIGTQLAPGTSLLARFDVDLGASTSFAMNVGFARIVPEPHSVSLLILGLVLLAARRERSA
jgi:hypothetical protein